MPDSPALRSRELQGSVIGVGVIFHDEPADLHEVVAVAANREMHGIGRTILWQMRAILGVAEIAALSEFLVRRRDSLMSRRGTVPGKTVAERETPAMRPQFGLVPDGRKEVGTGHEPSQELGLRLIVTWVGLLKPKKSSRGMRPRQLLLLFSDG